MTLNLTDDQLRTLFTPTVRVWVEHTQDPKGSYPYAQGEFDMKKLRKVLEQLHHE